MKKLTSVILVLCLAFSALTVCAAKSPVKYGNAHIEMLNYGEFPAEEASVEIPRLNSAEGAETAVLKELHEYLRDSIAEMQPEIDVSSYGIPTDSLLKIFTETVNYYPELFHISSSIRYSYIGNSVYSVIPEYVITAEEYAARMKTYNERLDYIVSGAAPLKTYLEKILYIHNYLVTNFEYDTSYKIYDAYSFLTTGSGVCQAYTQTFNALMHRLGIECTSAINEPEKHTWNIVSLDGEFYHIDCTHDDPLGQSAGSVRYDLFMLSDSSVTSYKSHTSWYTVMYDAICDSNEYESGWVWNSSSSGIVNSGNKWYYIAAKDKQNSVLMSTEDFISGTAVDSFNSIYHVYGSSSSYYPGYYGGLTAAGTTLYYSSPSDIRFYDTVTGETGVLGIDSDISISSCRYDGNGILSVFFSKKPNNYDDSGSKEITIFNAGDPDGDGIVTSSDLVSVQKYLLTGLLDINWAVYDVTGNIGVDILDFIRIKKLSAR